MLVQLSSPAYLRLREISLWYMAISTEFTSRMFGLIDGLGCVSYRNTVVMAKCSNTDIVALATVFSTSTEMC